MKENKLVEISMDFSVDIINLVKFLKSNHETIISNQIDGVIYDVVIVHDIPNAIAIESDSNFIGKKISFL